MILAECEIIDELTEKSEGEVLEVAKSLAKQTKYVVIECLSDLDNPFDGIMTIKPVLRTLDTEEIRNIYSRIVIVIGEELGDNHIKISVKFYATKPQFTDNIYI